MVSTILTLISAIISIYTVLCLIAIFMTWIPGLKFTAFGRFISSFCDPYLNLFSKWQFTKVANIDFSPIISIGLLSLLSSILSGLSRTGRIFLGGIIGTILQMVWSLISTVLTVIFLLIFIRWIVLISRKGETSSGWSQLDYYLQNIVYKISKPFSKGVIPYKTALLITWIVALAIVIAGNIIFGILAKLCTLIPF